MKLLFSLTVLTALLFVACSKLSDEADVVKPGGACQACHAAPPSDRLHQAHVNRGAYDCAVCHPSGDSVHANGVLNVAFAAPFNIPQGAAYLATTKSCNGVYCHGNFSGGVPSSPVVSDSIALTQCAACHDTVSLFSRGHGPHQSPRRMACDLCHDGYSYDSVRVNRVTHVNAQVDINAAKCLVCHTGIHSGSRPDCSQCHY